MRESWYIADFGNHNNLVIAAIGNQNLRANPRESMRVSSVKRSHDFVDIVFLEQADRRYAVGAGIKA